MKQSTLRIRRVRFKSGGEVRVLPPSDFREKRYFLFDAKTIADIQKDIAGYAIVAWGRDLSVTSTSFSGPRSLIPPMLVPELIAEELRSDRIEKRTIETMERRLGGSSPDDDDPA